MPIDTSIYGNLLARPKSMLEYGQELDQADMARSQLAQQKLNLIGSQQDYEDTQKLRSLYAKPGFDPTSPDSLPAIYAISPKAGAAAQKSALEARKTQADIEHVGAQTSQANATAATSQFDLARKKMDLGMQIVTSSRDPASAHAMFRSAVQQGLMTPEEAAQKEQEVPNDPTGFQKWREDSTLALMKASDRLELARKQAADAETARHNTSTEGLTRRGQDVTAATARRGQDIGRETSLRAAGYDANGNLLDLGLGAPAAPPLGAPAGGPAAPGVPPGGAAPVAPAKPGAAPLAPVAATAPKPAQVSPYAGLVDGIGTYQVPESVALARTPPALKGQLLAAVHQKYPDYDPMLSTERQATIRSFSPNGNNGKTVQAMNVATDHLATFRDLATALKNGDNQSLNLLGNKIAAWNGGVAPTNFEAAKGIVMDEVTKGVIGASGGQGDREKMAGVVAKANSPAQLLGAIDTVTKLMGGRLVGVEKSYSAGTGGRTDFSTKYLTPEAVKALEKSRSGSEGGSGVPDDIAALIAKHKGN